MQFVNRCGSCKKRIRYGKSPCPHCGTHLYWGIQAEAFRRGFPPSLLRTYRSVIRFKREAKALAPLGYVVASQERQPAFAGEQIVVSYRKVSSPLRP